MTPPSGGRVSRSEQSVQAMFSSIARFYDLNNTLLSLGLHHLWKRETMRAADLHRGECVIDIGTGTGDLARTACQSVGHLGAVLAVDLNEAMLQTGRKRQLQPEVLAGNLLAIRGNAQQLPVATGVLDVALTGFCLRNVADLDRALGEIYRVLRPSGRMVCLEFSRPQMALWRSLYDFYSFTLLPRIGRFVSKDKTGIYHYLPESIRHFPDQEALCQRIKSAGFKRVSFRNLAGGIVAIHIAYKAPP